MSKRIVILGAGGLIGHKLFERLRPRFGDVTAVLHGTRERFAGIGLFDGEDVIQNVDVRNFDRLTGILHALNPDVVLNCAGITKRRPEVNDPVHTISVNSLFPHYLANWAGENGKRVIHFSTDCVFNGKLGNYTEESPTTGEDAYGRTKALGEIDYPHTLTIRSSFVGRELSVHSELLDWFLQQRGKTIKGFTNAFYTGISTLEMARIVGDIIEHHPELGGLHQLSVQEPISKYDLLCLARDAFEYDTEIIPDGDFVIKPTLNSEKLRAAIPLDLPSWPEMMRNLAMDDILYRHLTLS